MAFVIAVRPDCWISFIGKVGSIFCQILKALQNCQRPSLVTQLLGRRVSNPILVESVELVLKIRKDFGEVTRWSFYGPTSCIKRCGLQCDQMAILFFNIWPFRTMKNCPEVENICQSRFTILPNTK